MSCSHRYGLNIYRLYLSVCLVLLVAGRSIASVPVTRVQGEGVITNDFFGRTLTVFDNQVIVGSDNLTTARNGGIVYAFSNVGEGWEERNSFRGSQSGRSSNYSSSGLDIFGDTLIVGARGSNRNGKGAAYIYHRNDGGIDQWGERAFLQNPLEELNDNDAFGDAVAIDNRFAAVGAPSNDDLAMNLLFRTSGI